MTPDPKRTAQRYSLFAKSAAMTAKQWTIFTALLVTAGVCLILSLTTDLNWPHIVAPACTMIAIVYSFAVREVGRPS